MKLNEFESLAKQKFSNATETVDVDNLLVDLHLKNQNNYTPLLKGLSMFLGLLIVGGALFYLSQNKLESKPFEAQSLKSDIAAVSNGVEFKKSIVSDIQDETVAQTGVQTDIHTAVQTIAQTDAQTKVAETITETANQIKQNRTNEIVPAGSETQDDVKQASVFQGTSITNQSTDIQEQNFTTQSNTQQIIASQETPQTSSKLSKEKSIVMADKSTQSESITAVKFIEKPVALKNKLVKELEPLDADFAVFGRQPQNCPSFGSKSWYMAIVPEIGYEHNMKTLTTDNGELSDLLSLRQDNEKPLEGYQFGLSLMAVHKSGLYIKGGAAYSKFTERMSLNRSYTELDTTIGIVSVTKSQNCDTLTTIYGDVITSTEVTENRSIHYNFTMIDIPLAVGYGLNLGSYNLDIEGGIMLNVKTTANGRLYTEIDDFEDLDNTNRFRRSLGLGFFASALVRKELSNGGAVYLGPRFEVRPTDFSTTYNPVNQNYKTVGLFAGYIHRF